MRNISYVWLAMGVVVAFVLAAACAPKPAPAVAPQPAPPSAPGPAAAPAPVPAQPAVELEWEKVVASARKEGKVTFYSVTYMGTDGQTVADAFYQRYGIRVDMISGIGTSNFERLRTEKRMGQMVGDVVQANTPHLLNMKEEGILETLIDLPVIRNKALWETEPLVLDPDGYVPVYQASWITPLINTRLVPRDKEPKSLRDLLKPEWKGKIFFETPLVSSAAYNYYVPFINRGLIDWSYVEAMGKQDLVWGRAVADIPRVIARGDFPIAAASWSGPNATVLLQGGPIKALSMEEGDPYSVSALGFVKGGPHPNAAKVFLNWLFGKEGAMLLLEKTNIKYDSLLKGVPSGTPEPLIPPSRKIIVISGKDMRDAAKLYAEQFMSKLFKLK